MPQFQPSRNVKISAITLAGGSWSQVPASLSDTLAMPWAYAGWLLFTFGAWYLCDELGATRPLNRAGSLMLAVGFVARTALLFLVNPSEIVRADLVFAIATLFALLLWSAALMHRNAAPKAVGLFGSLVSGGGLGVLIAAHIAVGSTGYWGFAGLFAALTHPDLRPDGAMASVSIIAAIWASAIAILMLTRNLRTDG